MSMKVGSVPQGPIRRQPRSQADLMTIIRPAAQIRTPGEARTYDYYPHVIFLLHRPFDVIHWSLPYTNRLSIDSPN